MKWRSLEEPTADSDLRPLSEIYAERKRLIDQYVPAATREIHARVVAELKERGLAGAALRQGQTAPEFELKDQNGKLVRSSDLLASGRLVIFFVRGRWCPFCVGQVEAMNLIVPEIKDRGAQLVAISPQTVQQSFFMSDQHQLRFPLLSDPRNHLARQFGLAYKVPGYQQAVYKRVFINLPHANGDESWELPVPATFILDREAIVSYASANEDYMERPEPAYLLENLHASS
jgi:peroxiredoxin